MINELEKNTIVEDNMGLVYMVAKKFSGRGVDFDDIVQIGSIGLIKASKKYNAELNVKFSTYAVSLIIGEIKRFFRDDGIIKIPRTTKETAFKVKRASDNLSKANGREPTIKEISDFTGISVELIVEALEATLPVDSIYQQTPQETYILDSMSFEENNDMEIEDKVFLKQTIDKLDAKAKQIILLRFFKQKTQQEVANVIGISQVQVSRLEKKALMFMRKMYNDN
ncbi:MAG: sigma-70 family RNA polymerase sigma factor [Clostridia bacterium]|nr:sigma-70 family RNA polymerase sigma factor [Clostridia bacterium]